MASSRYMMSSAKKPFASYDFGAQMCALADLYLQKYGPGTDELLGLVAVLIAFVKPKPLRCVGPPAEVLCEKAFGLFKRAP